MERAKLQDGEDISGCQVLREEGGLDQKGTAESSVFWSGRIVLSLVYGGGYMILCACQNSRNWAPKKGELYCMQSKKPLSLNLKNFKRSNFTVEKPER